MDTEKATLARRAAEDRETSLFQSHVLALSEGLGVACVFAAEALPGGRLARTLAVSVGGRAFPGFVYSLDELPCREVIESGATCHASGAWEQFAVGTALGMPEVESYVGVRVPLLGERTVWMAVLDRKPLEDAQLTEADLVERVSAILQETGLPGELLGLEVTESVLMANPDSAAEKLRRLKELGVRVAIDDFGTGYSSFSLLHRFPIDTLKLDRSFVARIPGAGGPTVRAIVALAHNLGMRVVAEGVETSAQRDSLVGLDCAFGQGHLFSEAVPPARAADLILSPSRW